MLNRPQLTKHRTLLSQIHTAKSKKSLIKVVQNCDLKQLRLLIKLIYDVTLDKIRLTLRKHVTKLFQYKTAIRTITANIRDCLKREESALRELLAPIIPVLKIFVAPLFVAITDSVLNLQDQTSDKNLPINNS